MARRADLAERDRRYQRIREAMEREGMGALVVAGHGSHFQRGYIRYVADTHIWAGDSLVLLPLEGEPVQVQVTYASASRPDEVWISDYREAPAPQSEIVKAMKEKGLTTGKAGVAGLERVITVGAYEELKALLPGVEFVSADMLMDRIRAVKSVLEISQNRELWKMSMEAMERFVAAVGPGVSQREAAAEAGRVIRAGGSFDDLTLIRDGGFKGLPRDVALKCEDIVELHLETCGESGHWSELNVTCVFQEPTAQEQNLVESELRAYEEFRRRARPGATLTDLGKAFHRMIEEDGWKLGEPAWHYYYHGGGMDSVEWPYYSPMGEGNRDAELEAGMVLSYHPHGAPVPPLGLTPRIFDDLVITESGAARMNEEWDLRWRMKV